MLQNPEKLLRNSFMPRTTTAQTYEAIVGCFHGYAKMLFVNRCSLLYFSDFLQFCYLHLIETILMLYIGSCYYALGMYEDN